MLSLKKFSNPLSYRKIDLKIELLLKTKRNFRQKL